MFFTETGSHNWIDSLESFIANYNDSYHRTIGMAPSNVTMENQHEVFKKVYPKQTEIQPCYFKKNDRVRIMISKGIFNKGYEKLGLIIKMILYKFFTIKPLIEYELEYLYFFTIFLDWSEKIYKISSVHRSINNVCYYHISPLIGEDKEIENKSFYGQQLNLVTRIQ